MNTRVACGLAATLCGIWLTGCQSIGTVRAQSPSAEMAGAQAIQQTGGWCESGCAQGGNCGPYGAPGCGPVHPGGGSQMHYYLHQGCPHGQICNALNPCHWCRKAHGLAGPGGYVTSDSQTGVYDPGPGWYPRHHHTYFYDVPDDGEFVYPPADQPPAAVQYPYYTVRGPSDFFMP
jgi:hypothetical protein